MSQIIVSDLHLSLGQPWSWCHETERDALVAFLRSPVVQNADILVLAGDTIDTWTCPIDVVPPTEEKILASDFAAPVLTELRSLGDRAVWLAGNHDAGVTREALRTVLPDARGPAERVMLPTTLIAHGHAYDLFCSRDCAVEFDGMGVVPIGYWVSRLAATADARTGGHTPHRAQLVRELLDLGTGKETLPQALLRSVATRAGVGPDAVIRMPPALGVSIAYTSPRALVALYADAVSDFERAHGAAATLAALNASTGELGVAAFGELVEYASVVVFGHTHHACEYSTLGKTYVNAGAWCGGQAPTYAEIDDQGKVCLRQGR